MPDLDLDLDQLVAAEVGQGAYATVHRIRRDGVDYAVKTAHPMVAGGEQTAVAFRREAAMLARIDHPAVPRVFDVGQSGDRPYLVMEYVDGRPLSTLLAAGPLRPDRVLAIGLDVAGALAAAHRAGLVHRDIKPANILVTGDGRAHLIDFGLAASGAARVADEAVAGTFDYSAPEQTGMLARPVDARADLYALGVVLFEGATGDRPFHSDNAGELIRMHATVPAPDPRTRNPTVPAEVAALIGRLLAKDPDDRYASAEQLSTHLRRLAGLPDAPAVPADELVGREPELAELRQRWRRALAGAGGFALLHGPPGVGTTAVAGAAAAEVAAGAGLVLTGRCVPDDATPAAALRGAVDRYAQEISALPEPERSAAVDRLRRAAGPGGYLLTPLSGTLAGLLDVPVPEGAARPGQFATAVAAFLTGLAGAYAGLFIQLDDVQWLDPVGCQVLHRLAGELAGSPLLLVATSTTEPTNGDSATRTTEPTGGAATGGPATGGPATGGATTDGAATGGAVTGADTDGATEPAAAFRAACGERLDLTRRVGPLDADAVARLVSAYLAGAGVSAELISEIAVRGRGNPFAILECLRALVDAGALRPRWGTWVLDAELLRRVELPDNVLDLVLARIHRLGEAGQQVLTVAAAIGSRFGATLLAAVLGRDPVPELAPAVEHGLLQRTGGEYGFVHDRVRDTLLAGLTGAPRRELHQRIAAALDARGPGGPAEVYAVASHYARGETTATPERVFSTGSAAGLLALAEYAPSAAVEFLEPAAAIAGAAGIVPDGRFLEALGRAYLASGRADAAVAVLAAGLAAEPDRVRRASLSLRLAVAYRLRWELDRSTDMAWQGLAETGHVLPRNPARLALWTVLRLLWWLVAGARRPASRPASGEQRERLRLAVELCAVLGTNAYMSLRPVLALPTNLHAARLSSRLGRSGEYAAGLLTLASAAAMLRLRRRRDRYRGEAFAIAAELRDPALTADLSFMWAAIDSIISGGPRAELMRVAEETRRWLNPDYYLNVALLRCIELATRGHTGPAETLYARGLTAVPESDAMFGYPIAGLVLDAMLGRPVDAAEILTGRCRPEFGPGERINYALAALVCAVERGDLGAPFEAAVAAFVQIQAPRSALTTEYRLFFAYTALGRLALARQAPAAERERCLADAGAAVRRLGRAANAGLLKAHHRVARADLAVLSGRHGAALRLLTRAEPLIYAADTPLLEYEAARVRARALRGQGHRAAASRQAGLALAMAVEHGWTQRIRWVRAEFDLAESAALTRGATSRQTSVAAADRSRDRLAAQLEVAVQAAHQQRDVAETLRGAMTRLAGILDPDQVRQLLLTIVAEVSPADRTLLVYEEDGVLTATGTDGVPRPVPSVVDGRALTGLTTAVRNDPGTARNVAGLLGEVGSWVAAPVRTHSCGHGVLLAAAADAATLGDEHLQLIAAIAGQAGTAYENARLYRQVRQLATVDALTGVSNRRHFADHAVRALAVARRNNRPMMAMMVDIDHFKKINDTHGHAVGDEVIQAVAQALRANVRDPDILCRYGGEEFAVLMTEMHGAPPDVAERIRCAVREAAVAGPDGPVRVTASIGVAVLTADDNLDTLLARADAALYRAKNGGRDQVRAG